jgi:hypothetical protein
MFIEALVLWGLAHFKEVDSMDVLRHESSNTFLFKAGKRRKTHFSFLISDFSAFGNPDKKPLKIRGNYRKCMKLLLENELNELSLNISEGEYFAVGDPVINRGRTSADIKAYCKSFKKGEVKVEVPRLDVDITLPSGSAIKVFSIKDGFYAYIVNDNGNFIQTNDFREVEEISGTYF